MEEEPKPQTPPQASNPNNINLGDILLPKKEIHAPDTAQRINAGALLNQEQTATLAPATPTALEAGSPQTPPTPEAPAAAQKPDHTIAPLQTYKGDVEKYVREKNVSVVSAAAAQAHQRTEVRTMPAGTAQEEASSGHSWGFYAAIVGGVLCIAAAIALVYFVLQRTGQLPVAAALQAPFIAVDGVADLPISATSSHGSVLADAEKAKESSTLSLGLVEQLRPITTGVAQGGNQTNTNTVALVGTQQFLSLVSPQVPVNLLRTLAPEFLLGVHTFDTHQPFLILKTDSYEEAFSGMLAWEATMRGDLSPLFDYAPSAHINGATPTDASSTASTTAQDTFSQGGFVDAIVENHDARVLKNSAGDMYFLWTFLDRTTIVITTNPYTLREVITRLKDAPLLIQPGR